MSSRVRASRLRRAVVVAGVLLFGVLGPAAAADLATATSAGPADPHSKQPAGTASATAAAERLIARVFVNAVNRGDLALLRDANGNFFVPAAEFAKWGLALPGAASVMVDGEPHVRLADVQGLEARFDAAKVTLHLQVASNALPGTTIDLRPKRRAGVVYPADTSFFLNYGFNAEGDDSFGNLRYQAATELGARAGNWLFYSTTDYQWGEGTSSRLTRLLTNAQYDDRPNLRRLTFGDFFTAGFDLSSSVPIAGVSLTKDYSMDPYFIQYPTAAFRTEVAFPSTVQVRVDGNVIEQRRVQPGPVDITNITGRHRCAERLGANPRPVRPRAGAATAVLLRHQRRPGRGTARVRLQPRSSAEGLRHRKQRL